MIRGSRFDWNCVIFVLILFLGIAARLYQADYNFDGDEVFSIKLATAPFSEVITDSLRDTPHPPLHNVLLHLWTEIFGHSEFSTRVMSVLFSTIFLIASYGLLRHFVPQWIALCVLALLSISPLFVYYGQQTRIYALVECFSAINLYTFIKAFDEPSNRKYLISWTISCCFLLYSQYIGALTIAAEMGIVLIFGQKHRLKLLIYGLSGSALIIPWILAAMGTALSSQTDPIPQINWMGAPTLISFFFFYTNILGEIFIIKSRWLLILMGLLGIAYLKNIMVFKKLPPEQLLLIIVGLGIPAFTFVFSVWGPKPIFVSRQLLGPALAFMVLVGISLTTLPRFLAAPLLAALLCWTLVALPSAAPPMTKPPWRAIAQYIDEKYDSTAVLTPENWIKDPLGYYRNKGDVKLIGRLPNEHQGKMLFACRVTVCQKEEYQQFTSEDALIDTWKWGMNREPIQLYDLDVEARRNE